MSAVGEAGRTRIATESAQLLQAFGSDDDKIAKWVLSVIEDAKSQSRDSAIALDWVKRVGIVLMEKSSRDTRKFMVLRQVIAAGHGEVFDSSKVDEARAEVDAAQESLANLRSVVVRYLGRVRQVRNNRT